MSNYFEIRFSDLSYEKQEDLIETVSQSLMEKYQEAGEELLAREWYDPKPKTWQEAFMRDIKNYDDDELNDTNWEYEVESVAEDEARNKVVSGFKYCEVEVDL